jgi:hypothetical protein
MASLKEIEDTKKTNESKNKDESTEVAELRALSMPERRRFKGLKRRGFNSVDALGMILTGKDRDRFLTMDQKDRLMYIRALPDYRTDYKTLKKGGLVKGFSVGGKVNGDNKLIGGQKKLDKNKDGKISGADFKMMKYGGEVKSKPKKRTIKKKTSMTSRGAGAALRGTKFVGVR